jgi:2-amino-4-hydroxy-6-hydroxymethyldihydropteridine diphosphokinase
MTQVYVGVGSNIDREANIRSGIAALRRAFGEVVVSTVYETEPVGFEANNFYNLVIGFDTELSVRDVAQRLHRIEEHHGHEHRSSHLSSRTLDLDLLLYDDLVVHEADLDVPRPDVTRYAFVLRPLSEIAGDAVHPETGKRIAEIWRSYAGSTAKMWPVKFPV